MPPTPPADRKGASRAGAHRRWLLFGLAWIFFALGALGAILPVIPTTPFMLLALWAFSASSERFHRWLYHHRVFGPPLQRWSEQRVIPLWVKAVAIGSMAISLAWIALGVRAPWYVVLLTGAVMLAGIVFLSRVPSRAPAPSAGEDPPGGAR